MEKSKRVCAAGSRLAPLALPALVILLAVWAFPNASWAITRDEAVAYALSHAESVRIAKEAANEVAASGQEASSLARPQIGLSGDWMALGTNQSPYPPPYTLFNPPTQDIAAGLSASQLIYAGSRIRNSLALEKNLKTQAGFVEATALRDIEAGVKNLFDAALFYKASTDINRDRVAQKRAEFQDANDLWEAGMVTKLDVRQIKQSLHFIQALEKAAAASYTKSVLDFNAALGRDMGGDLLVPEGDLATAPEIQPMIDRVDGLLGKEDLLDLMSTRNQMEGADLSYNISRGDFFPSLAVVGSAETQGDHSYDMDESWTLGLSASFNLYDGGAKQAKRAQAYARKEKARETYSKQKKDLAAQTQALSVDLASITERVQIQEDSVELARRNYEDAREQYRAGTITVTQLGDYNLYYAESRFALLQLYFEKRLLATRAEALLAGASENQPSGVSPETR
ncbi:MAG: TolC family protein [Thermodesulfobacteriota bacterium]